MLHLKLKCTSTYQKTKYTMWTNLKTLWLFKGSHHREPNFTLLSRLLMKMLIIMVVVWMLNASVGSCVWRLGCQMVVPFWKIVELHTEGRPWGMFCSYTSCLPFFLFLCDHLLQASASMPSFLPMMTVSIVICKITNLSSSELFDQSKQN